MHNCTIALLYIVNVAVVCMYKHVPRHHRNSGMGILCGFYCGEQAFATLKLIFIIIVLSYYCLSVETCLF